MRITNPQPTPDEKPLVFKKHSDYCGLCEKDTPCKHYDLNLLTNHLHRFFEMNLMDEPECKICGLTPKEIEFNLKIQNENNPHL